MQVKAAAIMSERAGSIPYFSERSFAEEAAIFFSANLSWPSSNGEPFGVFCIKRAAATAPPVAITHLLCDLKFAA